MSSTDNKNDSKDKQESQNAVIEIRISIPPLFGGDVGSFIDHMGKAARELVKAGRSFIVTEPAKSSKMKKIEIK